MEQDTLWLSFYYFNFYRFLPSPGRIIIPEMLKVIESGKVHLKKVKSNVKLKQGAANINLVQKFFYDSSRRRWMVIISLLFRFFKTFAVQMVQM